MVKKKLAPKWNTVRIREGTYKEIEKALETDEMERLGVSSISQFVTNALIKQLEELRQKSIEYVNMSEDHVKIMDRKLGKMGRIVAVHFRPQRPPYCDYCGESDCVHVQYVWELPGARAILKERGLQPPASRPGA